MLVRATDSAQSRGLYKTNESLLLAMSLYTATESRGVAAADQRAATRASILLRSKRLNTAYRPASCVQV